jgi:hypothetical protein
MSRQKSDSQNNSVAEDSTILPIFAKGNFINNNLRIAGELFSWFPRSAYEDVNLREGRCVMSDMIRRIFYTKIMAFVLLLQLKRGYLGASVFCFLRNGRSI